MRDGLYISPMAKKKYAQGKVNFFVHSSRIRLIIVELSPNISVQSDTVCDEAHEFHKPAMLNQAFLSIECIVSPQWTKYLSARDA